MKPNTVTIKAYIFIARSPETVWDYTQNYEHRSQWDSAVIAASVLQTFPNRIVRLQTKGNSTLVFAYKLDDRPHKTSLAAIEVRSPILAGGGGSWTYEPFENGTLWAQTNTLIFKRFWLMPLFLKFYRWLFGNQTRRAMRKAKAILERPETAWR